MSKQLIWNADLRQKPWKVDLTALVAVGTEGMEGQLVGRPAPRERAASSTSLLLLTSLKTASLQTESSQIAGCHRLWQGNQRSHCHQQNIWQPLMFCLWGFRFVQSAFYPT